jgi:hypothetical protein
MRNPEMVRDDHRTAAGEDACGMKSAGDPVPSAGKTAVMYSGRTAATDSDDTPVSRLTTPKVITAAGILRRHWVAFATLVDGQFGHAA